MTTRRDFLKLGCSVALAATLGKMHRATAWAQANPNRKLVIALAYGGWDPMFAFEPKPDSPEVDRIPGDVRMFGELPIWASATRPNVTRFFEQWGTMSAVLNGVAIDSLAHETCIDIMLTGTSGGGVADLGARVARRLGDGTALPYLALSPQAEVRGHESRTGMLGDTNQLMALANPDFSWPAPGQWSSDIGLGLDTSERDLIERYLAGSSDILRTAHSASGRSSSVLNDYGDALHRAGLLEDAARTGGLLANAELFEDVEAPWRHVAAALAEGLSQVAIVQPQLFWDTHEYNWYQATVYENFFAGLNQLMDELARLKIIDDTVLLVASEMGRTPRHNRVDGKDHWPWTSAMLVGANVRGGRVVGTTDDWLRPEPLNLATGAPQSDGRTIHAANVLATAARLVGIDEKLFEQEPIDAIIG